MSFLSRLFGCATREDLAGARLDDPNHWIVDGIRDSGTFFQAVALIFPEAHYMYFEGTTDRRFAQQLAAHMVNPPLKIAFGTYWPRPDTYHIPWSKKIALEFAAEINRYGISIPATHVHVHDGVRIVLEWHDAFFDDPIYIDSAVSEEGIQRFAAALGTEFRRAPR